VSPLAQVYYEDKGLITFIRCYLNKETQYKHHISYAN